MEMTFAAALNSRSGAENARIEKGRRANLLQKVKAKPLHVPGSRLTGTVIFRGKERPISRSNSVFLYP